MVQGSATAQVYFSTTTWSRASRARNDRWEDGDHIIWLILLTFPFSSKANSIETSISKDSLTNSTTRKYLRLSLNQQKRSSEIVTKRYNQIWIVNLERRLCIILLERMKDHPLVMCSSCTFRKPIILEVTHCKGYHGPLKESHSFLALWSRLGL